MATLFISDLHLDASRPDITAQFLDFLAHEARQARALYILGDLFEAWIGDDDPDPSKRRVIDALRAASDAGLAIALLRGNRDFLIGRRFARESGVRLLADGTIVTVHGRQVLLMHGDTLCTDDHAYQRLRRIVRNPLVGFTLRHLSLRRRLALAQRLRQGSKAHIAAMGSTAPLVMDVNQQEVMRTFRRYGVDCIVHGHTHRPAIHEVVLDDHGRRRPGTRIVLGDWYQHGSVLCWNAAGYELASLPGRQGGP